MRSRWWNRYLTARFRSGSTSTASTQKNEGRRVSERAFAGCSGDESSCGTPLLCFELEVRPEQLELRDEVLVAARDDADVRNRRAPLGREGRDQVAEAAAKVGHLDVGAGELRGP